MVSFRHASSRSRRYEMERSGARPSSGPIPLRRLPGAHSGWRNSVMMNEIIIRNALPEDLDECFLVETSGFPPEEAATRETIRLRIETFPEGFFVAELDGRVVGMLNSAATNKDDISDEELKQLIGHDPHGKNMVVF